MQKEPAKKRVKVIALKRGYYDHKRRNIGSVFMMNEDDYKVVDKKTGKPQLGKDGKQRYCSWVKLAEKGAHLEKHKEKSIVQKSAEAEEMNNAHLAGDDEVI